MFGWLAFAPSSPVLEAARRVVDSCSFFYGEASVHFYDCWKGQIGRKHGVVDLRLPTKVLSLNVGSCFLLVQSCPRQNDRSPRYGIFFQTGSTSSGILAGWHPHVCALVVQYSFALRRSFCWPICFFQAVELFLLGILDKKFDNPFAETVLYFK